ncbi:MAG: peptide synthase, partial [Planctomycetota bacterium]
QVPVIIVEPERERWPRSRSQRKRLEREVLELAATHEQTRPIRHCLIHPAFPVDIRHNSKIFREKLAEWAARRLKRAVAR